MKRALDRSFRVGGGHAVTAGAGAAVLIWFGPPGADLAAHVYQRAVFVAHGFALWNNYWYAGRYSFVTYSVLYYPLAAAIGIKLLAVLSVALAAAAFALLIEREWPAAGPWPARAFSAVSAASVVTGALPYGLGLALALLALVAIRRRAHLVFFVLVVLTFAASPLAFLLLTIVLTGVAATRTRRDLVRPGGAVVATAGVGILLWRAFPDGGRFPYSAAELAASLLFCVLGLAFSWNVERARVLRYVFLTYALACLAAFAVPSAVGENVARLRFVAIPLAVLTLSLRHWRPLAPALAALGLAFSWNFTPLAFSFVHSASDPSSQREYWQPVLRYLHRTLSPSYRVEAVDTAGHWEAVYLPRAGIPIARGWFRQDDFPQNRALYRELRPSSYRAWLRGLGVAYVVLTDAPLDFSARREAALLRSGRSGLTPVFSDAHASVYAVPDPAGIVTGPGRPRVVAVRSSSLLLRVTKPGRYRVAVRWAPYWSSEQACVAKRTDGMTELVPPRAGLVKLRFSVTPGRTVDALAGGSHACR